jgi:nucleotide-binding universal stress UspA family protein
MTEQPKFGTIVVAYDGSDNSARAVRVASSLASKFGSKLVVVHVYSSPVIPYSVAGAPVPNYSDLEKAAEDSARSTLARGVSAAKDLGVNPVGELLEASSTVQALAEFTATTKADLLVVGTRGQTGFKKLILGSVSSGVVAHAGCSVLVVR